VHVDLAFLRRHMPRLVDHLHYRIVDVSTVGELCRRWFPREHARAPKKKNTHTALSGGPRGGGGMLLLLRGAV
jgi:oligoribonuclease